MASAKTDEAMQRGVVVAVPFSLREQLLPRLPFGGLRAEESTDPR